MRLAAGAALLAVLAPGARGAEPAPAVAEVAGLLAGTYVSRDEGRSVRFVVAPAPKSRLGGEAPVFYVEAARSARQDAPFIQRFLRLEAEGSRVAIRVYEPRDLAGVRGKWQDPEALALFTGRDVRERPDCRMTLAKAPAGHWAGGTAAATCGSGASGAPLRIAMSLSPQTLEWREEGKNAAGKTVTGPAGDVTIFAREREGAAPAPALSAPVAGGSGRDGGFSSKVNEAAAAQAPPALEVTSPSSPSKRYSVTDLRGMAGAEGVPLRRFFEGSSGNAAAVVVVTSQSGVVSVFAFAEISSSSSPLLDVSGAAPRLVAPAGRGLEDVVSVELRDLSPAK